MSEAKLLAVLSGAVFDVVVDCRGGSPTLGQHWSVLLSAMEPALLYVPRGSCHGRRTLEPHTSVLYKINNYYSASQETGLRWNDLDLAIAWPLDGRTPFSSEKDMAFQPCQDFRLYDAAKHCPIELGGLITGSKILGPRLQALYHR